MMKLLHIIVSPNLIESASRAASAHLVQKLKQHYPALTETVLDLSRHPLPHLDIVTIEAFFTAPEHRTAAQIEAIATSDRMVDLLLESDILLIASPMWNLGLPSVLKAWFDHITRARRTFAFTDQGSKIGLVKGKQAYCVVASGSVFSHGPYMKDDQFTPYIRTALAYIGIEEVTFIRVDGTHDALSRQMALPDALHTINQLFI